MARDYSKGRILIIRLSSMGDIVLTLPVVQTIREAWPQARITFLVKEEFRELLEGQPSIDEVMTLGRDEKLKSIIKRVRAARFDTVLDLHSNLRSTAITLCSGSAQKVRYRKAALPRRLFVKWRFFSPELAEHTLDRYLEAVKHLGIYAPSPSTLVQRSMNQISPIKEQRILLIQTAFLGDSVLTTPLVSAIREHFPKSHLTILCTPDVAEIFQNHPAVNELIIYDKRGKDKSIWAVFDLVAKIHEKQFGVAFIPHRSFKSAYIAWAAKIPKRIGFSNSQGRWLLTHKIPFVWKEHDADRNLALLNAVGITRPMGQLWVRPNSVSQGVIDDWMQAAGVGKSGRVLGINPGSVWATKRWTPEGFAKVADTVISRWGIPVIFFGGPKDRPAMDQVASLMTETPVDWVGKTTLRELIAGISRCSVFLTNDSGPMHIAVACQIPTVAIFGPTTRELGFFPYGPGHIVLEKDLACRPCGLHGAEKCPLGHFECMKTIMPTEVLTALETQFKRVRPA